MESDQRPGLDPRRLTALMRAAIDRCRLDLTERVVLTEAATGAYVVTPILAAMAGARVYALANTTGYATDVEIEEVTVGLARMVGVADRIQLVYERDSFPIDTVDIVTNSGQVRPIDAAMVARLKPGAVIPLMYESWEYRSADVDVEACRSRGILVAGTSEYHPAVKMFSFLGPMAVRQLHDAGIAVYDSNIVLLCDNAFGSYIKGFLENCGAKVSMERRLTAQALTPRVDAVVLALQPRTWPVLTVADARLLSDHAPGTVVVQFWGDADRKALTAARVPVWPEWEPPAGHMAVLPSAVGPEPVVRLQAGGLKVGEVLARGLEQVTDQERALVQPL
jgi:hypothetical protein